jgi:hypothetical protein
MTKYRFHRHAGLDPAPIEASDLDSGLRQNDEAVFG